MTSAQTVILRGLEHIEQHLQDESLTPQALAAYCGYSYSHFAHIFKLFCGCTVGDYLRQRRLAAAAAELSGGAAVTDCALKWGFATPAGFTRAFTRQYGLSPQAYKTTGGPVILPSLPELITEKDVSTMLKAKFVEKPAFKIAGYTISAPSGVQVDIRTNGAWWQDQTFTDPSPEEYAAYAGDRDQIGIWWHWASRDADGELYYLLGVEADDSKEMPAGLAVAEVPAATYAVFETEPTDLHDAAAFAEAVRALWHRIYATELAANGLEPDPMGAAFEVYSAKNGGYDDAAATTEIWVPVRK